MVLLSALEDLQKTTLRVIRGSLRRLEYFAQLRDAKGSYLHWGLARVHGQERAGDALAESHRDHLSKVLSTPLRDLLQDVGSSSQEAGVSKEEYLARLSDGLPHLLPANNGVGSNRHLSSVLHALSSLVRAGNLASTGRPNSLNEPGAPPSVSQLTGKEDEHGKA
jgi:hypothetical protein